MARTERHVVENWATAEQLKWDVRWVHKKKRSWYISVVDCGDNLPRAMELYMKVKQTRHLPTLRCKNAGFPPPEELRPYWYKKKVRKQVGRRTRIVREDRYRRPMRRLNREGTWWCPYCRELREFVGPGEEPYIHPPVEALKGLGNGGRPATDEPGLYCPMCLVSTRDHAVRKWNPLAERF